MAFYSDLAKYYDAIYASKNYSKEAESIHEIISKFKKSDGRDLLEVACGTGGHIQFFKKYYDVVGSDINQDMLNVAKELHPELTFVRADMTSFDIKKKFDALTCLFGSISYLPNQQALLSAMNSFAMHLKSGGVVIIEPFLFWEDVIPNHISLDTVDNDGLKIARVSNAYKDGDYLVLDFHFVIGTPKGVNYYRDPNRMFLFSKEMFESAISSAGLEYHYEMPEWTRSGLVIGVKP